MKNLKTFNQYNESKVGNEAIGLKIKNDISKLINGDGGTLNLGLVDQVSEIDIKNIKQTYKNATIKVIDDHYILTI